MTTLTSILVASFLGGILSVCAAGLVAFKARVHWIPVLVSYAIGALLGAAFLEIIPEAFETAKSAQSMAATLLFGILLFFVLEKLVLWRHCHVEECEAHAPDHDHGHHHAHDHGRSGLMITVGDTFHNFVDGILIAAAFLADFNLGVVTALAIIAHEIPQEVGDFLILLHSGYSKRQALLLNLLSSVATLVGGVLAYYALGTMQNVVPYVLGLAASSMIYVAVADLIPGLHKRPQLRDTAQQVTLIALGVGSIWLTRLLLGDLA
ncbi:MAG TPA: ZIP family metal transporter [Methylophilaceae bacterium]|nr:ZIP family metal transporter [Methylophilaceae bacterium]HQR61112.1 ZIP family metal transporter [Methylophilaceae bacterium]